MKYLRIIFSLLFVSAASANDQIIIASGGDSLMGCSVDYMFKVLNVTDRGDCGFPDIQAATIYTAGNITFVNMGISATRLSTNANNFTDIASNYIAPIAAIKQVYCGSSPCNNSPHRTYIAICGIGSNDAAVGSDVTYAAYAAHHASVCASLKPAFDYVLMVTLLPRGDGTMTEPNRLGYDGLLTNQAWRVAHNIDGVIDIASDPIVGNPANLPVNNGGDTTWYNSDNIHYTDASSTRLVPIVKAALTAIAPAQFNYLLARDFNPANDNFPMFLDKAA